MSIWWFSNPLNFLKDYSNFIKKEGIFKYILDIYYFQSEQYLIIEYLNNNKKYVLINSN